MRPLDPRAYSLILHDKRLPHGAFRLWHLLADMAGKKGNCWPSLRYLKSELGSDYTAIAKWIEILVKAKYLKMLKGKRSTHYYPFEALPKLMGRKPYPHVGMKSYPMRVGNHTHNGSETLPLTNPNNQPKELSASSRVQTQNASAQISEAGRLAREAFIALGKQL